MLKHMIIPEGWTYFAHRTNTGRWTSDPFRMSVIKTNKIMSVVTELEIYEDFDRYGATHQQGYCMGSGEPFEIRSLICKQSYLKKLDSKDEMKNIMLHEFYFDPNNFAGCAGQRHHSIPKGEELIVMTIGDYDEVFGQNRKIIWTVPRRFGQFYLEEINKNKNRIIGLHGPGDDKMGIK